ncbi:MAG: hypothetical protein ACON34_08705 [Flavobacteriales bacterium]
MSIDKNNYEALLIDYLDGTLNAAQEAALWLFLEEHPELREEFEGLADVKLTPPTATFDAKNALRQPDAVPTDRDHLLAQYLEGHLSPEAGAEVFRKIATDPEWAKAWSYMEHTRLKATDERLATKDPLLFAAPLTAHEAGVLAAADAPAQSGESKEVADLRALTLRPDTAVVFPGKRGLKRTPVITLAVRWTAAIAAAVMLAVAVTPLMQTGSYEATLAQQPTGTEWNVSYPPAPNTAPSTSEETPAWTTPAPSGTPVQFASNTDVETGNTDAGTSRSSSMTHARRLSPLPVDRGTDAYASLATKSSAPAAAPVTQAPGMEAITSGALPEPTYITATDYLTDQVKTKLWGDEAYPEDNYVLALAEKTTEKWAGKELLQVEPETEAQERAGWKFQLGKFKIERNVRP